MKKNYKWYMILMIVVFLLLIVFIQEAAKNRVFENSKIEYSKNSFSLPDMQAKSEEFLLERARLVNYENKNIGSFTSFY